MTQMAPAASAPASAPPQQVSPPPAQQVGDPVPPWLRALLDQHETPTNVPRSTLDNIATGPPQFSPNAPNLNLPNLPDFAGGNTTLDRDLRSQRNTAFQGLNDLMVELSNMVRDSEGDYLRGVQGQERQAQEMFRDLANNFASRGVMGSSGYGQEYISGTEDVTRQRNELDETLGRLQRDVLQGRSSAVQTYQNLLNDLIGIQGERDATKRVQDILGRSSGGGAGSGSGGGAGGGSTIKKIAPGNTGMTVSQIADRIRELQSQPGVHRGQGWG
jgi:hypothetical protein